MKLRSPAVLVLVTLGLATACVPQERAKDQKTFVLVHGAWGGAWDYQVLSSILTTAGHFVYRPTLTGLGERVHLASPDVTLGTHVQDIVSVLEFGDLRNVVLVGHSYGGMVITAVAHRVPERIAHLVYVDAMLPEDGESVWDLLPEGTRNHLAKLAENEGGGWQIPPFWPDPGKDVPHPLATFREAVSLESSDASRIPGTYILTQEPGAEVDDFSAYAERARSRDWPCHVLRTNHNPQRTMPNELAALLMEAG
jgi:pimeloyl-ACP methyl ester carboxylesterase